MCSLPDVSSTSQLSRIMESYSCLSFLSRSSWDTLIDTTLPPTLHLLWGQEAASLSVPNVMSLPCWNHLNWLTVVAKGKETTANTFPWTSTTEEYSVKSQQLNVWESFGVCCNLRVQNPEKRQCNQKLFSGAYWTIFSPTCQSPKPFIE